MDSDRSARRRHLRAERNAESGELQSHREELRLKRGEARRDFWRTVLQGIGGAVVLVGVWLASQDAREARDIAEAGQLTDRFSRAVDQLGNTEAADVRIGGIYALERIAKDSPYDRSTVAEVLASFVVRTSSSDGAGREGWQPPNPLFPDDMNRTEEGLETEQPLPYSEQDPLPDVQAAATVLARMQRQIDPLSIDLGGADLTGADLHDADLRGADLADAFLAGTNLADANLSRANLQNAALQDADLAGADLRYSDFTSAWLPFAILTRADMSGADLQHANLSATDLRGSDLRNADLSGASLGASKLSGTNLRGADLSNADLSNARLGGIDLSDADLSDADLRDACVTPETSWPGGFRPTAAGVWTRDHC